LVVFKVELKKWDGECLKIRLAIIGEFLQQQESFHPPPFFFLVFSLLLPLFGGEGEGGATWAFAS
jgi:hypothetical protein